MNFVGLQDIKQDIQNIAEAISSALKVDVTIVDEGLVRIAGTGKYVEKIGQRIEPLSAFGLALREGQQLIIENPRDNDVCKHCNTKLSCKEFAEVCCPIELEQQSIGVIGLVALDEKQGQSIKENKSELMTFLRRMGELISSKIKAESKSQELLREKSKLETLFNTIDKAVVSIDDMGMVEKYNSKFVEMFELDDIPRGVNLMKLLPFIDERMKEKSNTFFYEKNSTHGIYSISAIAINNSSIGYLLEFIDSRSAIKNFNDMTEGGSTTSFGEILGSSSALAQIKQKALSASKSPSTLLITGESGTGKELFARAIHHNSDRRGYPFVAINCGAIPDTLLESELFGYEEGAFTGAKKGGKLGKFEIANKGTLFLDEIGDMSLHLQVKLLRVLQERELERIGANKKIKLDVRIICATNKNLEDMVDTGEFRGDLYFRLNVIPLYIPPLRDRREDIPLLVESMIKRYNAIIGKSIEGLDLKAQELVKSYSWPGNVRELQNTIEYAVNMTEGRYITVASLPERLRTEGQLNMYSENSKTQAFLNNDGEIVPLRDLERNEIQKALKRYGDLKNNKEKVCQALGISKATLYRKIKEYK